MQLLLNVLVVIVCLAKSEKKKKRRRRDKATNPLNPLEGFLITSGGVHNATVAVHMYVYKSLIRSSDQQPEYPLWPLKTVCMLLLEHMHQLPAIGLGVVEVAAAELRVDSD